MLAPTHPARLGQNQYGKAECRLVRISRDGPRHQLRDLNVSVALSGDLDETHHSGRNTHVLPTDTMKNTVFALAKRHGVDSPEQFGVHLAQHFVTSQRSVHRAQLRIEEYLWERISAEGTAVPHSFVRTGQETRTARVTRDGDRLQILSGLSGLTVLNTTGSEFHGFAKDAYTTLEETDDRVLATEVTALWRTPWTDGQPIPDWDRAYQEVRQHLTRAFAETYSYSLQQTLYQMGTRVLDTRPEIEEIRLSLPNKHHHLVDLRPFGLDNANEIYVAADRPYGLIEATVLRDGATARIPVDLTHLS